MPRLIKYNPQRIDSKEAGRRAKIYRVHGYKTWIDPFPDILGTIPEKMVYEQLSRRGIEFWFQNEVSFAIPEIDFLKNYRPDIVLPGLRIIIEVQGSYWHSKPQAIQDDAFKFAVYQSTGWTVLGWWDYDIIDNVNKLFMNEPLLSGYGYINNKSTETNNGHKILRDDTKGIATLNYRRAIKVSYRKKPVTIKKSKTKGVKTYVTGVF